MHKKRLRDDPFQKKWAKGVMTFPGHFAGAWIVTRYVTNLLKPSSIWEQRTLFILGTIAGLLPDLDWIWYAIHHGLKYDNNFRHHTWISHTFPFYWFPTIILYIVGTVLCNHGLQKAAFVFAAGATIHLVQDSIGSGDGIMLFYPFSKKMYGIALSGLHGKEWAMHYKNSQIFLVEVSIILLSSNLGFGLAQKLL